VNPVLAGLDVAGEADAWRAAGFTVDDDGAIRTGAVRMQSGVGAKGIAEWHLAAASDTTPAAHANATVGLDHLVVFSGDPGATIERYAALGLEPRRVREIGNGTTQTFFRSGEPIIELVGPIPDIATERFWGLAFTTSDLDACAALLGDALGRIKEAVQPGRRIATLRHKDLGLTVPIAFMSE
jgi:hypothetical protein